MSLELQIRELSAGITQAKDMESVHNRHEFIFREGICALNKSWLYRSLASLIIPDTYPIQVQSCKCRYYENTLEPHTQFVLFRRDLPDRFKIPELPTWQQEYLAERVKLAETLLEFLVKTNNFLKLNLPPTIGT